MTTPQDDEFRDTIAQINSFCDTWAEPAPGGDGTLIIPHFCRPEYNRQADIARLAAMLQQRGYTLSPTALEALWSAHAQATAQQPWDEVWTYRFDLEPFLAYVRQHGGAELRFSRRLWLRHNLPWRSIGYWAMMGVIILVGTAAVVGTELLNDRRDEGTAARCAAHHYSLAKISSLRLCADDLGRLYDPSKLQ